MLGLSIVSSPQLSPDLPLCDYDELQFVSLEMQGPDIRALLNSTPVKQLDPYPFTGNPQYLRRTQ